MNRVFERKRLLTFWRASLLVAVFLWLHPVSYRWTRIATITLLLFLCVSAFLIWRTSRLVQVCGVALVAVLALALALPARSINAERLGAAYVKALTAYDGTRYVWGGENRLGIDCSGLVRRGLIDASLRVGIVTLNAGLVRESLVLRWFDCSANALRNEYRQYTQRLFAAESIRGIDHSKLKRGDIAVTSDGVHVLAYLGERMWIEADPDLRQVVRIQCGDDNPWLMVPVEIMRWRLLEDSNQKSL